MNLNELQIINFKNIREADLQFSPKLNAFVGANGQGKTNLLDAIYYLSFTKSAFNAIDSQNICHDANFAMIQGVYDATTISCSLKHGVKKQFRRDKKDYSRLMDHIGLIPLVMLSPEDVDLIDDGSDARRRFMDTVISQIDRIYLEHLSIYTGLVKQRNALLKQYADAPAMPDDLLEVIEAQMIPHAQYIYAARNRFIQAFVPVFAQLYQQIADGAESPQLIYRSQLQNRDMVDAFVQTRSRDKILGWTSQGVHKDELEMLLGDYPLRRVGSQGQQKTYVTAMKLAQALYLTEQLSVGGINQPILLLDDIFDRLDAARVERIINLVRSDRFGQIFITDTDRQHLTDILRPDSLSKVFNIVGGNATAG